MYPQKDHQRSPLLLRLNLSGQPSLQEAVPLEVLDLQGATFSPALGNTSEWTVTCSKPICFQYPLSSHIVIPVFDFGLNFSSTWMHLRLGICWVVQ